jgi:hypothetical protein
MSAVSNGTVLPEVESHKESRNIHQSFQLLSSTKKWMSEHGGNLPGPALELRSLVDIDIIIGDSAANAALRNLLSHPFLETKSCFGRTTEGTRR